jgi:hypothetical protein
LAKVFQVGAPETAAAFCFAGTNAVVDFVCGNGEDPLEVDPQFGQTLIAQIKLSLNCLKEVITFILVIT